MWGAGGSGAVVGLEGLKAFIVAVGRFFTMGVGR
jgi:hypothetical protein